MTADFAKLNAAFAAQIKTGAPAQALAEAGAAVREFMDGLGATKMRILPQPLIVDRTDFDVLVRSARLLLDAQTDTLRHMLGTWSRARVLDFFGFPPDFENLVGWEKLTTVDSVIARIDVLPTAAGYRFCEFNVDTSISGIEFFDCYRLLCSRLGLDWMRDAPSPQEQISALVADTFHSGEYDRVVLCDWSSRIGVGYFGFDLLRQAIRTALPDVEVHLVYHGDYPARWLEPAAGRRTLVYRGFMYEDIDDFDFLHRLLESEATVINRFETEIRTHKRWFSLWWDETYRALLTPEALQAISDHVPRSVDVGPRNIDALLADRSRYVFKYGWSSGGHDVLMGADHPAETLRQRLLDQRPAGWIAQDLVPASPLNCRPGLADALQQLNVVLGLYIVSGSGSGMNIRADALSNVVNIHQSASSGWAIPMDATDREHAVKDLERVFGREGVFSGNHAER